MLVHGIKEIDTSKLRVLPVATAVLLIASAITLLALSDLSLPPVAP